MNRNLFLLLFLAVALCCPTPLLARSNNPVEGGLILGLEYFTPLPSSSMHDMLYPNLGIYIDRESFYLEATTAVPFLLADGIVGAIRFLSGVDAAPPLWGVLNNWDDNPGRLKMLSANYRYSVWKSGRHKFDAGGVFDVWWLTPFIQGKSLGNVMFNVGPTAGYGYHGDIFALTAAVQTGLGMGGFSLLNPFAGFEVFGRWQVADWFGLYLKGLVRAQSFDYSGHEPNDPTVDPRIYDLREWETMFQAEAGFVIGLFR